MYTLSSLGFGPFFSTQLEIQDGATVICARVAAEHRGAYEEWSEAGSGRAQLTGRLRLDLEDAALPGAGDWVVVRDAPSFDRTTVIEQVLARRTVFTRGSAGRETRAQVVAANVDLVFAVCGLDADYNIRRIERYLARIWASGAQPVVILNKADLCEDVPSRIQEVESLCAGVPVHAMSALLGEGLETARAYIRDGMTVALAGSSGAGKSTLVNALLGEERMRTGEVSTGHGRGRHITTSRQLVFLPGGGLMLDTPGMRELQLAGEDGLDSVFGDIAVLANQCRYRDCRHDAEPGCAVKAAVEAGELDAVRLEHFRKLEREAQAYELRHDEHKRRQAERVWGQLSDELARLRKWKGGKP